MRGGRVRYLERGAGYISRSVGQDKISRKGGRIRYIIICIYNNTIKTLQILAIL